MTQGSADPSPVDVRTHLDVVYARTPGFRPLSLDLYVPAGDTRALCVYLHGGGWRMGARTDGPGPLGSRSRLLFERMARGGLAVASVDYRLSGEATFPAQRDDVTAAAGFLAEHAAGYGVPDVPLVTWGVSAGGHLAALLALAGEPTPPVAAAVCWYSPTDLVALPDDVDAVGGSGLRGPDARESMLIGAALTDAPALAAAASPVTHVHPGAPPFMLVHGAADVLVPAQQSRRLADALGRVAGEAEVLLVDGARHMFADMSDDDLLPLVDRSTTFLLDAAAR